MRVMGVTLLLALAMLTPAATAAPLVVVEVRGVALMWRLRSTRSRQVSCATSRG